MQKLFFKKGILFLYVELIYIYSTRCPHTILVILNNKMDEGDFMKAQLFKKTFPSELKLVKQIIKEIMDYLYYSFPTLSSEDYFDCKLIYNELLVNAVIHGNENNKSKTVSVTIEIVDNDSIYSTITDEGDGFDYKDMLHELKSKDRLFSEGGRGIQLVQSLTSELHYDLSGKQIRFYKRMTQNG